MADLNGKVWSLPADLPAERTLVIVSYFRSHAPQSRSWIDGLDLASSALPWLQLPVIDDPGAFGRERIDNGMRAGVLDAAKRARIVTIYTDKAAFRRSLGVESDELITVAVIDRRGNVLARAAGSYEPTKAVPLLEALKAR